MVRNMTVFYLFSHELSESLYKLQGSISCAVRESFAPRCARVPFVVCKAGKRKCGTGMENGKDRYPEISRKSGNGKNAFKPPSVQHTRKTVFLWVGERNWYRSGL